MSATIWQPGTLYVSGALVVPVTQPSPASTGIANPSFETGAPDNWTLSAGWVHTTGTVATGETFEGVKSVTFTGTGTDVRVVSTAPADVNPGQSVTATCMIKTTALSGSARVYLEFLDAGAVVIGTAYFGNEVGKVGAWFESSVTAEAPGTTTDVRVGVSATQASGTATVRADYFTWNAVKSGDATGLLYKAVQATAATSGATEPVWPTTVGLTVVDGGVTWEAVQANSVTWQAFPLMVSHTSVEPTWPLIPGAFVIDGGVKWECVGKNIQDENCPHSKVVAIVASKVFATDGDIVRFCATVNPLDWTTANDAGYLPTGIQQANANDAAVMGIYRSNLVVFNASTFQMWQVDPDPAAMALLDQMEGIGSVHQQAAQPVGDELFFLSQLGARTVGIAAGSTNLSAGDVGSPVDTLVQAALVDCLASGQRPIATYYPSAGQYWLAFPGDTP